MQPYLIVFFRWLHVTTACLAVGGVFFLRIIFPIGLKALDADNARAVLQRSLRVFKMVIHTCILCFILSGTYNAVMNWSKYSAMPNEMGHSLFGIHLLLAIIVMGILLWLLIGKEPKKDYLRWMTITLGLMLLTIAAASVLKYARDSNAKTSTIAIPAPVAQQ